MQIQTYKPRAGVHWETGALANILQSVGARAPHTGKPWSEALLFGLGGGVGAGYLVFQIGDEQVLSLHFRHSVRDRGEVSEEICARIGVPVEARQSSSVRTAAQQLEEELEKGRPVFATCAEAGLTHRALPPSLLKRLAYGVGIFGIEGENALVDDRSAQPIRVPLDELARARSAIAYNKNRMLSFGSPKRAPSLQRAIREAIGQCWRGLLGPKSGPFGIQAFERWAGLLQIGKDKNGWPTAFADSAALRRALTQCFKAIEVDALGGMRPMYCEFLEQAQEILGNRKLADAARRFKKLGTAWTDFAEALLPAGVPGALETKVLLRKRRDLHAARGAEALPEVRRIQAELEDLGRHPLGIEAAEVEQMLPLLQERLVDICRAERAAAESLRKATS